MTDNEIKEKIKQLVDDLNKWNHEYFDLDLPSVSDRVYDTSLEMLIELEKKYPQFVLSNSPTQKIGAKTKDSFKKIKHSTRMLSLNKAYSFNDLEKFILDIKKATYDQNVSFIIEPKIDGLSISLHYKNGKLTQAITRGDGSIGEDVSFNVINIIKDVPVFIPYQEDLEVRGEVFIYKSIFKKINQEELSNYANPRNLAAGTLRQLNPEIVKRRNLSTFIYDVVDYKKHNLDTQKDVISFLNNLGFNTFKNIIIFDDHNEICNYINEFDFYRNNLDYETDGIVLKLNQIKYYDQVGYTIKHPKYAIAFKFDDEVVETTLDDIFITIGRTGMVTYNAKLKPVLLKGTTVSAATLHNYNYIKDLELNIGDQVRIKKAGEIIPKVISVSKKMSQGVFQKILYCSSCGQLLNDTDTQNNQICTNEECSEKNIRKIIHFSSREGMNIEGLAEGIIRKFYDFKILNNIQDIYTLENHKEFIVEQKGFGNKFWNNLSSSIEKSKKVELDKLIFSIGINQMGTKNAKQLAIFIKKFENIKKIDFEQLSLIRDIGPITISEIKLFMSQPKNIELIDYLINIGINPSVNELSIDQTNIFFNKIIVITGTFDISRNKIISFLESRGAKVVSSISKNTDIILVGENPGSKLDKANELNIKKIFSNELMEILS